jgi:hypothetical protein
MEIVALKQVGKIGGMKDKVFASGRRVVYFDIYHDPSGTV